MATDPVQYDFGAEDDEPRSSKPYLQMIKDAERQFQSWQAKADRIDKLYSSLQSLAGAGISGDGRLIDREYNLFWASVEVIKPSIYSRPPVPVVTPRFKDRTPLKRVTAELLERAAISGFEMTDIDQVMLCVRDDLVIVARGVTWVTYENDGGTEKACVEHLDRTDFVHDPVRKWSEVGWVARRAWMTRKEMRERFEPVSGDLYASANFTKRRDVDLVDGARDGEEKAGVWELWHKGENKVVWVAEGCEETLEQDEPHLKLQGFFPCPRPAYGTLQRRSLVPVPDISYIEDQLETINELTARIHGLCDKLVVKGIIPSGTDVGDAVERLMREQDASYMLIPVPSMSLTDGARVEWLPIEQVAQAILAAVEARREIIGNVQELFGIADIMRGETEAAETAKAQTLKAQYGSVRIRDRVNELIRIARETVQIVAEIMAEEFDFDTLLDMSQMELPTDADVKRQLKDLQAEAKKELKALASQAEALAEQGEVPPEAEQQFQQQQQAILAKYQPQIEKLGSAVTHEMVRDLLRDDKLRPFVFDIETDSTIYPDEQAEKESRSNFLIALSSGVQALMPMVQSGGAKAAGDVLKFVLAPFRPGREVEASIDEWIEAIANAPPQGQDDAAKQLAESQMALAQAELQKAQAQTMKVEADAQGKMQEIQLKAAEAQANQQADQQRFMLEIEQTRGSIAETEARVEKIMAEIQSMGFKAQNDARTQDREDFKVATDAQFRANDQARAAETTAFDQEQRVIEGQRSDADHKMMLAERAAQEKPRA